MSILLDPIDKNTKILIVNTKILIVKWNRKVNYAIAYCKIRKKLTMPEGLI